MGKYKYSKDDYYRLTNAPCIDVALALGMEINEKASDNKAWKMKGGQGLCIYREGNNWYRFSDGRHGFPIDLVKDKLGCSTEQALDFIAKNVLTSVSEQVTFTKRKSAPKELPKEKNFAVPAHDIRPDRVFAYLAKTRGIDSEIIKTMLQRKMIAEDSKHHNCLFFGRDETGIVRSCAVRGTNSSMQFRGEAAGGNKAYTFAMPGKNNILRLFESPIDAMSHATFSKLLGKEWTNDHRLSTNGCGSYDSIKKYIENHSEITDVWFAFDNDEGGRKGAAASSEKLKNDFPDRDLKIHICYPPHAKDWNDDLQLYRQRAQEGISAQDFVREKNTSVFKYKGFHFEPIGYIPADTSLSDIALSIESAPSMEYNRGYSYDEFVRACNSNASLFRCIDTNQICFPNQSEIYIYNGDYIPCPNRQQKTMHETQGYEDEDDCDMEME